MQMYMQRQITYRECCSTMALLGSHGYTQTVNQNTDVDTYRQTVVWSYVECFT